MTWSFLANWCTIVQLQSTFEQRHNSALHKSCSPKYPRTVEMQGSPLATRFSFYFCSISAVHQYTWLEADRVSCTTVTSFISLQRSPLHSTLCVRVTSRWTCPGGRYLNMRGQHQIYGHLWSEGWSGEKKDIPEIVCKSFEENTFLLFNLVDIWSWIFAVTPFPIVCWKTFLALFVQNSISNMRRWVYLTNTQIRSNEVT